MPFALLAHPTVQAVRFLSKVMLAWFLPAADFGEVMLAGLLVLFGTQMALAGLDEAAIYAHGLGEGLWTRLRRVLHRNAFVMAVLVAAAGEGLGYALDDPVFAKLTFALAPLVWVGNLAALPTALLVRRGAYARVFAVDGVSVIALAGTTLALAAAGAGMWSMVGGWYANAFAGYLVAEIAARPFHPAPSTREDDFRETVRYGHQVQGAGLVGLLEERVESFAVGFGLGRAALGVYEMAMHLSQFLVQYAGSLAERCLFPVLTARHRDSDVGPPYLEAQRLALVFLFPAHVVLAVISKPLVNVLFPAQWGDVAPLLALLAIAAAMRSADLVASTAIKACGQSRAVLFLSLGKLGILVAFLFPLLTHGPVAVAKGVLAARSLGAVCAIATALTLFQLRGVELAHELRGAAKVALLWSALFVPAALALRQWGGISDKVALAVDVAVAAALWIGLRVAFDRAALNRERTLVRHGAKLQVRTESASA